MSRIFDALRRSEQEKSGKTSFTPGSVRVRKPPNSLEQEPAVAEANVCLVPRIVPERHVLACGENHTLEAEKFRVLRHRLYKIRGERALKNLLICSAIAGEGKTLVAVNLSLMLARTSQRVLLIDADLRHSGVHDVLGLEEMSGLAEFLQGRVDERTAIRRLAEPWNLCYLPAGHLSSASGELLQGPRMGDLLKHAGETYDWVVVDSAPISLFADTPHLATLTDGSLLVTRLGVTPADSLPNSLAALEGTYIVGIVVNGDEHAVSDHYEYYKYAPHDEGNRGRSVRCDEQGPVT